MTDAVDWDLAIATGHRLAPRGPDLPRDETVEVVAMLRDCASRAVAPVAEVTGLIAPLDRPAQVIDRRAWVTSNVGALRVAMAPLFERAQGAPEIVRALGSKGTAVQIGAVLAWLSGKVLGQYEVFTPPGRLLLVAPTIVHVERTLDVPPADFRLWVCLHEETHRVQFGAVPWLADHLLGLVTRFVEASDVGLGQTVRNIAAAVSTLGRSGMRPSLLELVQTPEQRELFDELTGIMSLLEGHADVVMDAVGPEAVPSVALIRERFTARRSSPGAIDAVARRALGMDVKLRQYSEGAAFVRTVVDAVGMHGFNEVWESPRTLPSAREIRDPRAWLSRMATSTISA